MRKKLSMLSILLALTIVTPASAFAARLPVLDYVSLGDSLAAGQTPYGVEVGKGYSDFLAKWLDEKGVLGKYVKAGQSGLDTKELLAQLYKDRTVSKALRNSEIVTMTIGANDLLPIAIWYMEGSGGDYNGWVNRYPGSLTKSQLLILASVYQDPLNPMKFLEKVVEKELLYVGAKLSLVLMTTKVETLGRAKIYVMGYYSLPAFPEATPLIHSLNQTIKDVAEKLKTTYVPTITAFAPHPEFLPGDIHPTVAGYETLAVLFWAKFQRDFKVLN